MWRYVIGAAAVAAGAVVLLLVVGYFTGNDPGGMPSNPDDG
jgi:hypothetical protein